MTQLTLMAIRSLWPAQIASQHGGTAWPRLSRGRNNRPALSGWVYETNYLEQTMLSVICSTQLQDENYEIVNDGKASRSRSRAVQTGGTGKQLIGQTLNFSTAPVSKASIRSAWKFWRTRAFREFSYVRRLAGGTES